MSAMVRTAYTTARNRVDEPEPIHAITISFGSLYSQKPT